MPVGRVDTSRFWEQVLQVLDEGRVIPVLGPDLLVLSQGDSPTLLNGRASLTALRADYR